MEELEKVDVGEVRAVGGDKSPSSLPTSKNEVATQDIRHTTTCEARRDVCVTVQRHREKVPLTHLHRSIMVLKRTMYLGDLKVLKVFRIVTILPCQNLRGRQLVPLTRSHGSSLVPNKAIHLGDP